jgi:hypothetical protein
MKGLLLAAALVAALTMAAPASAKPRHRHPPKPTGSTVAVIGDIPYGDALITEFPQDVQEINADPDVARVIHLGDIKNGSSRCDTSYFQARFADFQSFEDPFVYTPGDNEWTDCHRANNGGYLPTERLDTVRRLFFPRYGRTLGRRPAEVAYQSRAYPENVAWSDQRVIFGAVHVVGSNDDHDVWFGDRKDAAGAPAPETRREAALRAREYTAREAAALDWIDTIFDAAERTHAPGVVLGMQADMWDPAAPASELTAFDGIKAVLGDRPERFGKPVLLLEGDSHILKIDTPAGQPDNLTRIVVQGSTNAPHEWTKLKVDPSRPAVFSCQTIQFVTKQVTPCLAPLAP